MVKLIDLTHIKKNNKEDLEVFAAVVRNLWPSSAYGVNIPTGREFNIAGKTVEFNENCQEITFDRPIVDRKYFVVGGNKIVVVSNSNEPPKLFISNDPKALTSFVAKDIRDELLKKIGEFVGSEKSGLSSKIKAEFADLIAANLKSPSDNISSDLLEKIKKNGPNKVAKWVKRYEDRVEKELPSLVERICKDNLNKSAAGAMTKHGVFKEGKNGSVKNEPSNKQKSSFAGKGSMFNSNAVKSPVSSVKHEKKISAPAA